MNEIFRRRRTLLACVLIVIAIAAPCTAWYIVGSAAVERESEDLQSRPIERGEVVARTLADRLLGRLEAIRDAESQRPTYHFQATYEERSGSCQCDLQTPSPLATGPRDPFVEGYFQIDVRNELTMPTLSTIEGVEPDPDRFQRASERFGPLSASIPAIRQSLEEAPGSNSAVTGNFQWHSVVIGSEAQLVALRRVGSGPSERVQGFFLSPDAVSHWLDSAELPAKLRPGITDPPETDAIGDVQLDCTRWEIAVDVRAALAEADARARSVEVGFLRGFLLVSLAALLAGLSVIALLLHSERVALQRSQFAAAAAHELRTPLTGLRLYGELIGDALGDQSKLQRYSERITEESERLARVVTNVLGFTRLERGSIQVKVSEVDLTSVVEHVVQRQRPALTGSGATIELSVPEAPVRIQADAEALEQILQNLIDNAEKYSRESEDRRIHVSVRGGERVELSVRDHGPGIDAELGRKLFRPFERGGHPDQPAGLGLGLALVRELAIAQGASVGWENCEDGGSEFVVAFG